MDVYEPACGNVFEHREHLHWTPDYSTAIQCRGYSQVQQDIAAMMDAARWAYRLLTSGGGGIPDQARLEIALPVTAALQANTVPAFDEVMTGEMKAGLPVKVADDLPAHGWRIVIDQGVIRSG